MSNVPEQTPERELRHLIQLPTPKQVQVVKVLDRVFTAQAKRHR